MDKKLTKHHYKKLLPADLYTNTYKGKRGQGELKKTVTTRLTEDEQNELTELLTTIKVKRAAFVRYAIKKYMNEVKQVIDDAKTER